MSFAESPGEAVDSDASREQSPTSLLTRLATLPVLPSGKIILLLRQSPFGHSLYWEIPRGPALPSESEQTAARRQILLNTGYRADRSAVSRLGSIQLDRQAFSEELSLVSVFLNSETPDPAATLGALDSAVEIRAFSWLEIRQLILAGQLKDAAALSALTLFHELHGSGKRPKSYELSASFFIRDLRGEYFNAWYPAALRLLNDFGLNLDLGQEDPLMITASGAAALTEDQIEQVVFCLADIGKHCVGRLWTTQIINGREAIDDLSDPDQALNR